MRQTSQAVLLLISAASAADPLYASSKFAVITPTLANQGVPMASKNPVYQEGTFKTGTTLAVAASAGTASAAGTASCLDCIKGAASANAAIATVWCSAVWNYEYVTLAAAVAYPAVSTTNLLTLSITGGDAASSYAGDQGQCCYVMSEMTAMQAVANKAAGVSGKSQLFNKITCAAKFTNDWATNAIMDTVIALSAENWWCSDGSYNIKVNNSAYGTNNVAASSYYNSLVNSDVTVAVILPDGDRRNELMWAACRQKNLFCGGSGLISGTAAQLTAGITRTILKAATNAFDSGEKCTWVMESTTKAPTFKISNTNSATTKPLTANWDVMYQEWVDGWQLTKDTDYTSRAKTNVPSGGVVFPHITYAKYNKAAKYNYVAQATTQDYVSTNNSQQPGMAALWVKNTVTCTVAALHTTADSPANCWRDTTKKVWFNSSSAKSSVAYYNKGYDAYNTAKGTYNTSATTYNTYLADLKTANEKDAFSAFFSPPVKPKFVKRPAAPTMPSTYDGITHWSLAKQTSILAIGGLPALPTLGKEFILGNNSSGGWGAWTISRLAGDYAESSVNFITHSFGMLGTSQSATLMTNMSYLKNFGKDGFSDNGLAALKTSTTGSVMCQTTGGTSATGACLVGPSPAVAMVANTKSAMLNVSVWASGNTARTVAEFNSDNSDFTITFYASEWGTQKDWYVNAVAPAAGTALTEPAAAQALAATAAAALAVAAALY